MVETVQSRDSTDLIIFHYLPISIPMISYKPASIVGYISLVIMNGILPGELSLNTQTQ